jgi:hypothetical protein
METQLNPQLSITGEVIFESVHHNVHKKTFKEFAEKAIARRLRDLPEAIEWANFYVIVSPGQDHEEVRCQVDVETDGEFAGFAIGFGFRPNHAFNDAVERLQWYEKNQPLRLTS